jgi:hypothetical protein
MGVTVYTSLDLINQVIVQHDLINCVDIGSAPGCNLQASAIDNSYAMLVSDINKTLEASGEIIYIYDVNHSSPPGAVPTNAQITKVDIQIQTAALTAASNITLTYPGGTLGGTIRAFCKAQLNMLPSAANQFWASPNDNFSITDTHQSAFSYVGAQTQSASLSRSGAVAHVVFDFTTNPGGSFPLGYSTYGDFINNFANMVFGYIAQAQGFSAWDTTPPGGSTSATGSVDVQSGIETTNWQMTVTWQLPFTSQWTIDTPTITKPDDILQLSRPDPHVPPPDDTQQIEAVTVKSKKIKPNDPWVVLWTLTLIIIHLPPDVDTTTVDVDFVGTEFSGSVSLGALTVINTDLSGIYTFDEDTHHDELYARTTTSTTVTTQNVAITPPFFVTAFIDNPDIEVLHYTGTRMRVTGAGTLKQVFQSLDYINTQVLSTFPLRTSNNLNPFTIANFIDQNASLRVYMDALDDFMNVSTLVIFSKSIYTGYPQ